MSVFFFSWKTVFKQSRQLLDISRHLAYLLSSLASFYPNLDSFSIHQESFCLLGRFSIASRSIKVGFFSIDSRYLSINRDTLAWISFFSLFCIFFLCVHSIFFFSFSCRSMVPCSPYSLYFSFLSVLGQVFWLFMPFDNRVKKGENFENWMSLLRGSNRLRGRASC